MTDFLIHPATKMQLQTMLEALPHAVLMSGEEGAGKKALALYSACHILGIQNLDNYPYFFQITPEKQTIGIEAIRALRSFLNRRTTGSSTIRRIVLIGDAQTMTNEAQNALLKSLEEPPDDTIIMLTASDINLLKPTIVSRAQHINVRLLSLDYALATIKDHDEKAITSAYYMSGGRIGLLVALLEQKADHRLVQAIEQAKTILRLNTYQRLLLIDGLSKQKADIEHMLAGLQCVVTSGLAQAALKNNKELTNKFHLLSRQLSDSGNSLRKMGNPKLVLSDLFLQM